MLPNRGARKQSQRLTLLIRREDGHPGSRQGIDIRAQTIESSCRVTCAMKARGLAPIRKFGFCFPRDLLDVLPLHNMRNDTCTVATHSDQSNPPTRESHRQRIARFSLARQEAGPGAQEPAWGCDSHHPDSLPILSTLVSIGELVSSSYHPSRLPPNSKACKWDANHLGTG